MKNSHLTGKERLQKLSQRLTEGEVFNPVDEGVNRLLFSKLRETNCLGSRLASDIWFDIAFVANLPDPARGVISIPTLARKNHSSDMWIFHNLKKLEELKFIKIIKKGKGGKATQYAILWHPLFGDYDDSSLELL